MIRIAGAQAKAVAVGHVHHIRIGGIIRHLNTVNNTSEEVIKLRFLNDLDLNGIRFFLVGHSHRLLSRCGVVKSRHRETLGDDLATVIVIGNCNTELQFIAGIARRFSRLYGNRHDVLFHHWLRVLQRRIAAPIVLECAAKGGGKIGGLHFVSGFEVGIAISINATNHKCLGRALQSIAILDLNRLFSVTCSNYCASVGAAVNDIAHIIAIL